MRRKSPTSIEELADWLDLGPEHLPLLRLALVHRSQGETAATNNERLEFLGDAVLGMLTNEYLYEKYPQASEGELTRMKANVVNKTSLARSARPLNLGLLLDMARSEEALGGRDRTSTLADAFEAVLGAIYLSAGLDAARRFVHTYLFPEVDLTREWDYKSSLQELLQERYRSAPRYKIISESGPAHAREFVAEVYLGEELLGMGRGGSKKQAEQVAAAEALMVLATRARKSRRSRKSAKTPVVPAALSPDGPARPSPGHGGAEPATTQEPGGVRAVEADREPPTASRASRPRRARTAPAPEEEGAHTIGAIGDAAPEERPAVVEPAPPSRPRRRRTGAASETTAPTPGRTDGAASPAGEEARAANRRRRRTRAVAPLDASAPPDGTEGPVSAMNGSEPPARTKRPRSRRAGDPGDGSPPGEGPKAEAVAESPSPPRRGGGRKRGTPAVETSAAGSAESASAGSAETGVSERKRRRGESAEADLAPS